MKQIVGFVAPAFLSDLLSVVCRKILHAVAVYRNICQPVRDLQIFRPDLPGMVPRWRLEQEKLMELKHLGAPPCLTTARKSNCLPS